jgi:ankyrin repeat protein
VLVNPHTNVDQPTTDDGVTPLLIAAQEGHIGGVRMLVDARVNADQVNVCVSTALSAALRGRSLRPHRS